RQHRRADLPQHGQHARLHPPRALARAHHAPRPGDRPPQLPDRRDRLSRHPARAHPRPRWRQPDPLGVAPDRARRLRHPDRRLLDPVAQRHPARAARLPRQGTPAPLHEHRMTDLTPREIVSELDRFIVGQN
ncbi:MAG: hypothetical protein ACK56I_33300, partial [bacterium]